MKINPKIKGIEDWTKKRLEMNNNEGYKLIEQYKI